MGELHTVNISSETGYKIYFLHTFGFLEVSSFQRVLYYVQASMELSWGLKMKDLCGKYKLFPSPPIQVSESPFLQIGWLLVKINPDCPTLIPSLDVPEQPVDMAPTNHTISLPGTAQELVNTCMTELNRLCNTTLINGVEDSYT